MPILNQSVDDSTPKNALTAYDFAFDNDSRPANVFFNDFLRIKSAMNANSLGKLIFFIILYSTASLTFCRAISINALNSSSIDMFRDIRLQEKGIPVFSLFQFVILVQLPIAYLLKRYMLTVSIFVCIVFFALSVSTDSFAEMISPLSFPFGGAHICTVYLFFVALLSLLLLFVVLIFSRSRYGSVIFLFLSLVCLHLLSEVVLLAECASRNPTGDFCFSAICKWGLYIFFAISGFFTMLSVPFLCFFDELREWRERRRQFR